MNSLKEITEYRGVWDLVYAKVMIDNNEEGEGQGYVTGPVKPLAGVAEITKTTASSSEPHFYDNMPATLVNSTGEDEIKCKVSAIDLETMAEITGNTYDSDTGTMIEGERSMEYFAIGYKTAKTNGDVIYVWRLKGMFSIPDSTHVTKDSGTTANGQELTYTGISTTHKFQKTGKGEKSVNTDLSKGLADTSAFFDTVTTPDTLKAKA